MSIVCIIAILFKQGVTTSYCQGLVWPLIIYLPYPFFWLVCLGWAVAGRSVEAEMFDEPKIIVSTKLNETKREINKQKRN